MAELQQDVNIFTIFEEMHELSHILMLHRTVDFDLTHQLLLSSTPLKGGLLDDFGSCNCFVVTLNEFVAFSKTSFSKKFSFDILPVADLPILMFDSFLNYSGTSIGSRMKICLATAMLRRVHDRLHLCCSSSCARSLRLSSKVASMKWLTTIEI